MKKAALTSRILLGLVFFIFGLNGFLQFIPAPPPTGAVAAFMNGIMQTGYFFPLLKGTETIIGALFLLGYIVPLALVILTPIQINIFLFHLFLEPASIAMPLVLLMLHTIMTIFYWGNYKAFFNFKNAWKQ